MTPLSPFFSFFFLLAETTVVAGASLRSLLAASEPALKLQLPFYHTSSELHAMLEEVVGNCPAGTAVMQEHVSGIDIITVSSQQESHEGSRPSALFVFGEHARELFSAESAVHFVRTLCGLEPSVSKERARTALLAFDFVIVPNANPKGRRMVEDGNFCKRTNENGVDLNRNYGSAHRDATTAMEAQLAMRAGADVDDIGQYLETNPGPSAFSEPETQAIRDLAKGRPPHLFLSVHTGALVLGMPFGYSNSDEPPHAEEMRKMSAGIREDHCAACQYGSIAKTLHYRSKGCSVDYFAEEIKVPYVFTWEIYVQPGNTWSKLQARWKEEARLMKLERREIDQACLQRFNPTSESVFNAALDNWSGAYLDLAGQVETSRSSRASESVANGMANSTESLSASSPRILRQRRELKADLKASRSIAESLLQNVSPMVASLIFLAFVLAACPL